MKFFIINILVIFSHFQVNHVTVKRNNSGKTAKVRSVSTIEPPYLYFQEVLEVTPQDMNVEKDADAASDHNLLVATIKLKHTHTQKKNTEIWDRGQNELM